MIDLANWLAQSIKSKWCTHYERALTSNSAQFTTQSPCALRFRGPRMKTQTWIRVRICNQSCTHNDNSEENAVKNYTELIDHTIISVVGHVISLLRCGRSRPYVESNITEVLLLLHSQSWSVDSSLCIRYFIFEDLNDSILVKYLLFNSSASV